MKVSTAISIALGVVLVAWVLAYALIMLFTEPSVQS